jgi:hypothetical protein
MVIQSKWFCKLMGINGITLYPFIIVNDKNNDVLLNHERIHLAQQKELYVLPFYYLYLKSYFKDMSYWNICFEKEAYDNQDNLLYLKTREKKAYKKYLY